jgi:hypothetical protein
MWPIVWMLPFLAATGIVLAVVVGVRGDSILAITGYLVSSAAFVLCFAAFLANSLNCRWPSAPLSKFCWPTVGTLGARRRLNERPFVLFFMRWRRTATAERGAKPARLQGVRGTGATGTRTRRDRSAVACGW